VSLPEETCVEIRRLFFSEHFRIGTIALQLGIHPEAVRRAVGTGSFANAGKSHASALDEFLPLITEVLGRYPRLTATRVHEKLLERGYTGSVIQLRRKIRKLALRPPSLYPEAYFRLHALPGEQAQVDWAYYDTVQVGNAARKLWLFVMVLSHSRAVHVCPSFEMGISAVMRGHVEAFETFGGVPRTILYDNMKTVVLEREGNAIRFHPGFLKLAGHYLFDAQPCNPGRGSEKGRVERRIRDLRTSFLAGRSFLDIEDLRQQFLSWRDRVAYVRPCPGNPELTVAEALEAERSALQPLPLHPVETDELRTVTAPKQPYVRFDTNLYSIPYTLVGKPLLLAASDRQVRLIDGSEQVACHERSWQRGRVIEDPTHLKGLAEQKRKAAMLTGRSRLLAQIPQALALYTHLIERNEPLGPQTVALLKLVDRYGAEQVTQAIGEAIERGTPRASSVAAIIDRRRRLQGQMPLPLTAISDRPEIRDLRVANHKLEDYDELIERDRPT
jgi:transposase